MEFDRIYRCGGEWYGENDSGETEIDLPTRWEICPQCDGEGQCLPAGMRGYAYTESEFYGPDWDDDSRHAYFSGGYDVPCDCCQGSGKVRAVDHELLSPAMRKLYAQAIEDEYHAAREREAEIRWGY